MILKIGNVGLIRNPENEVWTVSKDKTTIQVLRPNGFKIEIMQ